MGQTLIGEASHLEKSQKKYSILYSAFVWAVFSLGICQLILVLLGPSLFLLGSFSFSILFSIFLFRQKGSTTSRLQITNLYLLWVVVTLCLSLFYGYFVFLKFTWADVQLFGIASIISLLLLIYYYRPKPKKSLVI